MHTLTQPPRGSDATDRDGNRWTRFGDVWIDAQSWRWAWDWPTLLANRGPMTCRCDCPPFTYGPGHRDGGRHVVSA